MTKKELNEIKLRWKGISKIIDRCGSAILKIREDNHGVGFEIHRSAFRGAAYAFKVLKQ